jgi:hypothetical protein
MNLLTAECTQIYSENATETNKNAKKHPRGRGPPEKKENRHKKVKKGKI